MTKSFSMILFSVLYSSFCPLLAQTGYGDIRIGAGVSTIPFDCKESIYCEGEYKSEWVIVGNQNNTIDSINVIYKGNSLQHGPINAAPITLAQALREHSLQNGMKLPILGLAINRKGETYGVVDIANMIVYHSIGSAPDSLVTQATYVLSDAPVLGLAESAKLPLDGRVLIDTARISPPYSNTRPASTTSGSPEATNRIATTRAEASRVVSEREDVVIGRGRMVLALIEKVSTWYEIDKNHPDAIEQAEELRNMYPKFESAWKELILYADTNKSLLANKDLTSIPFDLDKEVESKLRQLKAMGFEE